MPKYPNYLFLTMKSERNPDLYNFDYGMPNRIKINPDEFRNKTVNLFSSKIKELHPLGILTVTFANIVDGEILEREAEGFDIDIIGDVVSVPELKRYRDSGIIHNEGILPGGIEDLWGRGER